MDRVSCLNYLSTLIWNIYSKLHILNNNNNNKNVRAFKLCLAILMMQSTTPSLLNPRGRDEFGQVI